MVVDSKITNRIDVLKRIAAKRNGLCLTDEYNGLKVKAKWQCQFGHQWEATLNSVLHSKSWCPACAGNQKLSIEMVRQIAKSKGGKCLSAEYCNSKEKLLWECKNGHRWYASTFSIKTRNSWCPECYKNNVQNKTIGHENNK